MDTRAVKNIRISRDTDPVKSISGFRIADFESRIRISDPGGHQTPKKNLTLHTPSPRSKKIWIRNLDPDIYGSEIRIRITGFRIQIRISKYPDIDSSNGYVPEM